VVRRGTAPAGDGFDETPPLRLLQLPCRFHRGGAPPPRWRGDRSRRRHIADIAVGLPAVVRLTEKPVDEPSSSQWHGAPRRSDTSRPVQRNHPSDAAPRAQAGVRAGHRARNRAEVKVSVVGVESSEGTSGPPRVDADPESGRKLWSSRGGPNFRGGDGTIFAQQGRCGVVTTHRWNGAPQLRADMIHVAFLRQTSESTDVGTGVLETRAQLSGSSSHAREARRSGPNLRRIVEGSRPRLGVP